MSQRYFHFTLGPVQGFVAQARRTKDFYAASFLLSWLAGVAILAVEKQDGKILFPKADDNFLDWMTGRGKGQEPLQGSIPNRFSAEVSENFHPEQVVATVKAAWAALAEHIWQGDIAGLPVNLEKTAAVWAGQVDHFFEITWVLADSREESNLLDRRKNWRIHAMPAQSGMKCQIIEGLQELSGEVRPEAKVRDIFWETLRRKINNRNDLRQGEYLCAIAWIKRRFVHYFKDFSTTVHGIPLKGWKLNQQVPSVAYLAALPWLANTLEMATRHPEVKKAYSDFYQAAQRIADHDGWAMRFSAVDHWTSDEHLGNKGWGKIDGSVFFEEQLESRFSEKDKSNQKDIDAVKIALKGLQKKSKLSAPSPFYAVLLMDGDSLGKQMGKVDKQAMITNALENFTKGVPKIINDHSRFDRNGFLVYAGGDDVLALLPLEEALPCAAAIRQHYLQCFAKAGVKGLSTISAAIIFAHIKMPLLKPLAAAHPLLDAIAKDLTGRDALAVQVLKPGGEALTWSLPWQEVLNEGEVILMQMLENIRQEKLIFANKFFYEIKDLFDLLNPKTASEKTPEVKARSFVKTSTTATKGLLDEGQKLALLAAEYVRSGAVETPKPSVKDAEEILKPLIAQCLNSRRDAKQNIQRGEVLTADAALLLRFLLQKGHVQKDDTILTKS